MADKQNKTNNFGFTLPNFSKRNLGGFTLIELLIVVGILAVLLAIAILLLNPGEFMAQARDSQRISDLKRIDTALVLAQNSLYESLDDRSNPNIVYISLPDTNGILNDDCKNSGEYPTLSALAIGWQYRCVASLANLKKTDGNGWLPVNFNSIAGNPLKSLPVDPVNDATNYYAFGKPAFNESANPNSYALSTPIKSGKYLASYANNANGDGGKDDLAFETRPVAWTGAPSLPQPPSGYALQFDGVDDYINIADSASLDITGAITIEAWVKPDSVTSTSDWRALVYKLSPSLPKGGYGFLVTEDQSEVYFFTTRAGGGVCYIGTVLTSNQWYHVVGSYQEIVGSEPDIKLYINSVGEGYNCDGYSPAANNKPLYIGGNPDNDGYAPYEFDGIVDEVRIYNRALSVAEVQEHYNGTFINEAGLVGLWRFNEGSGATAADTSGNGNNGNLINNPQWVSVP